MGGGGSKEVKYVGPSKEELAAQREQYGQTVSLLQQQNAAMAQQYESLRGQSEQDYAAKNSLMQDALNKQKLAYDEVLGTTRKSAEDAKVLYDQQGEVMRGLTDKQQQASAIQQAAADKDTTMARETTQRNRNAVSQSSNSNTSRRRKRGMLSVLSGSY